MARWTGGDLAVPIDLKVRLVKALPSPRLPTRIIGHGTDDGHAIVSLAIKQYLCGGIPFVHKVLGGKLVTLQGESVLA